MADVVLLIGAGGQVGSELARALAPLGDVRALDRAGLDLRDAAAVRATVSAHAPRVIVNAAAYTRVDDAESKPGLADEINARGPELLARAARQAGALLVHYSTDYVFDGRGSRPYRESDPAFPETVYGRSKLRGDEAVLQSGADAYVFRVGWVYGTRGRNFLLTVQRLLAGNDDLRIVADQHGAPTWSRVVAEATAKAVWQWTTARRTGAESAPTGVYHMAPPDHTTWYGFAEAISDLTPPASGRKRARIIPIATTDYPTAARRPAWSVLDSTRLRDTFGLALPPWREQLQSCLGRSDADAATSNT